MAKSNRKLIKEAIADAKQMRETAVATARVALEEAFAPQFSALIAQRLREEDEEEWDDEELEELNDPVEGDAHGSEDGGETDIEGVEKSSFTEDVDDTVSDDTDLESSGIGDIAPDHGMKTAPGPKEPTGGSGVQSSDIENDDKLGMNEQDELDIDDEEEDELEFEQDEFEDEYEDEDDLDLESVIAELEADLEDDEFEDELELGEDDDEIDVVDDEEEDELELGEDDEIDLDIEDDEEDEFGLGENWPDDPAGSASDGHGSDEEGEVDADALTRSSFTEQDKLGYDDEEEEEFDLEEILREIEDEEDEEDEEEFYAENKRLKTELKEHRDAILFLRSRLQEMNLLNAKLLYTTKLFRNFNLNNESKLRVVENFDRAGTVREAKLVYTTLAEAFKGGSVPRKTRRTVTESIASRRSGSTKPSKTLNEQIDEDFYKPAILTEGDEMKTRLQKLAGINRRR